MLDLFLWGVLSTTVAGVLSPTSFGDVPLGSADAKSLFEGILIDSLPAVVECLGGG